MDRQRQRILFLAVFLLPIILFVTVEYVLPTQKWHPVGPGKQLDVLLPLTLSPNQRLAVNGCVRFDWDEESVLIADQRFWEKLPITTRKGLGDGPQFSYPLSSPEEALPDPKAVRSIKRYLEGLPRSEHHSGMASLSELWQYERQRGGLSESEKKRRTEKAYREGRWKLTGLYRLVRFSATPYEMDSGKGNGQEQTRLTVLRRVPIRMAIVGKFALLDSENPTPK